MINNMETSKLPTFLSLKEEKDAIINLVLYYKNKNQESDDCFEDIIEEINKCKNSKELEYYWRLTDNWIRQHAQESGFEY